ncbi:MAG: Rrf2 family transcriptional regulator [Janthinobacterium lividum]
MRLTTKGRLAVVAMIDVALHHRSGPIALAIVSRRQRISLSYLEQMFAELRRHGLVASTRGPGGGYTLARDSKEITVADILFAVDGPVVRARCAEGVAPRVANGEGQRCTTPELWDSLSRNVVEFLDAVTLCKLADDQLAAGVQLQGDTVKRAEPLRRPVKPKRPNAPNSVFELGKFSIA